MGNLSLRLGPEGAEAADARGVRLVHLCHPHYGAGRSGGKLQIGFYQGQLVLLDLPGKGNATVTGAPDTWTDWWNRMWEDLRDFFAAVQANVQAFHQKDKLRCTYYGRFICIKESLLPLFRVDYRRFPNPPDTTLLQQLPQQAVFNGAWPEEHKEKEGRGPSNWSEELIPVRVFDDPAREQERPEEQPTRDENTKGGQKIWMSLRQKRAASEAAPSSPFPPSLPPWVADAPDKRPRRGMFTSREYVEQFQRAVKKEDPHKSIDPRILDCKGVDQNPCSDKEERRQLLAIRNLLSEALKVAANSNRTLVLRDQTALALIRERLRRTNGGDGSDFRYRVGKGPLRFSNLTFTVTAVVRPSPGAPTKVMRVNYEDDDTGHPGREDWKMDEDAKAYNPDPQKRLQLFLGDQPHLLHNDERGKRDPSSDLLLEWNRLQPGHEPPTGREKRSVITEAKLLDFKGYDCSRPSSVTALTTGPDSSCDKEAPMEVATNTTYLLLQSSERVRLSVQRCFQTTSRMSAVCGFSTGHTSINMGDWYFQAYHARPRQHLPLLGHRPAL